MTDGFVGLRPPRHDVFLDSLFHFPDRTNDIRLSAHRSNDGDAFGAGRKNLSDIGGINASDRHMRRPDLLRHGADEVQPHGIIRRFRRRGEYGTDADVIGALAFGLLGLLQRMRGAADEKIFYAHRMHELFGF